MVCDANAVLRLGMVEFGKTQIDEAQLSPDGGKREEKSVQNIVPNDAARHSKNVPCGVRNQS